MAPQLTIRRLRATVALAAAASAALAVGIPAPATAAEGACQAKSSRTEEANRHARVYSVRRVSDDAITRRWYGCLYRFDRRVRLGDVGPAGVFLDRISPVRLAGRYVATANEYTATLGDALEVVVQVRDLRTGAFVRRFQSPSQHNTYDVTDLELRSTGAVAWIARVLGGTPATTTYEVRVFTPTMSHSEIVDSGPAIGRRSLALSGRTLYWTNDGTPRSTRLG